MAAHLRLSLLLLLIRIRLFPVEAVRFTILPNSLVGSFGGREAVRSVDACSQRAHKKGRVGFRVELDGEQLYCSILEHFRSFEDKKEGVGDYVLDTSLDGSICYGEGEQNVIKLVSGACKTKKSGCETLSDMNTYCHFVGRDIPNCVSGKGDSVESTKCPQGHTFIGIEKETLLCCPPKTKFVKESAKKALCCPEGTEFEKEADGKAVCCPKGTTFQRTENGKDLCCPGDTEYKGSSEGKPVCCPKDYQLNTGWSHCCPKDFVFKQNFKQCVGMVSMGGTPPKTTAELKKHCTDKAGSIPVKIENAAQNMDILEVVGTSDALIGLHVPVGKYKMHWIADDSLPKYNNMNAVDKEHTFGDKGEHFGKFQSKAEKDPGFWYIVNPAKLPPNVVCMAPLYEGT
uniref:EGF-like domain-containing protein n=1 Tax=Steinernema glaseri TaxID=37863 RepID=A0A1I8AFP6_9BILA